MTTEANDDQTAPDDASWRQLRDDLARLRRQVLAVAEDLERYASDLRPEKLPMSERKLAWTLRQIVAGEQPETAPESPQADEQAEARAESHTEPAGTVDDALHRIALHRIADHLDIPPWISPAETAWRVIAEIDRLRTELDEARAEIARLGRAAHEQGADLWTAEDWVDWLRERVRLAMDLLSRVLATTAPETAPESPQTGEQTQVRADTHTGAETGSQEPLDLDAIRAAWLRVCGSCGAGYPTACTCPGDPRNVIDALVAEIDRLRTERDALRAEVERAREIAHSYRHEIGAAQVFDVLEAALGTTPDTGSTT